MSIINVQIGQEVAVSSRYSDAPNFGYAVKRVTPSGQIVLVRTSDGHERRFDKEGREIGDVVSRHHGCRDHIITDLVAAREAERVRSASIKASNLINSVRCEHARPTWGKESFRTLIGELETKLAAAKAAVEEI